MASERDIARRLAKAGDDDISDNILEYQVSNQRSFMHNYQLFAVLVL
jgi:hypothetical protein